tara:strand:- start:595 stop:1707 length:1113 start_codon:yes stop_codon:yes gene_type:complete
MKNLLLILLIPVLNLSQTLLVPDINFENKLIELGLDNVLDGQVEYNVEVEELDLSESYIQDLTGIEAFPHVEVLDVSYNLLTVLDLGYVLSDVLVLNVEMNPLLSFLNLGSINTILGLNITVTNLSCIQTQNVATMQWAYNSFQSFFATECGCTNPEAANYELSAMGDDGSCIIYGCTDITACNYNEEATNEISGLCEYSEEYYDCDDDCLVDLDEDGVCDELEVSGCTDSEADNFNSLATDDDGSCYYIIYGCADEIACNYDELANEDLGGFLCDYPEEFYDCNGDCLLDTDLDNVCDELDNCPDNYNPFQEDFNFDDVGDACDGLSLNEAQQKRKLVRITDILGRGIQEDGKQKIRLYIYDDGWVERK